MRSAVGVLVLVALTRVASADPLFLNVLPAGQDGLVPQARAVPGPHAFDQLAMYRALPVSIPGLEDADLFRFFKDASLAAPANPERLETPRTGVTVARDGFGVPHVTGATRGDVFFGAGWVTAEDRLFLADALRHIGRGRFSAFAGGFLGLDATIGFDRTYATVAGYSDDELAEQITSALAADPVHGPQVLADATEFVGGLNAYIAAARADATKMPAEYALLGIPLTDWQSIDVVAATVSFTTVIGFGNGGGGEDRNVVLRQALQARYGTEQGAQLWEDLRSGEDPEAPVTTTRRFDYMQLPRHVDPAAVATPDPGSIVRRDPLVVSGASPMATMRFAFPRTMSNWLVVTGAKAARGVPILVGGPQTGYFAPQDLIELSLEGPGIAARGAGVPGTPYVVLGHTPHYAFTATSGGSDLADVRAERLCTPPGGAVNSGTVYRGDCRPMYRRVDTWPVGQSTVTATIERTVHGPVIGHATVDGQPIVLALERTSFNREVESGAAFVQLDADQALTPRAFRDAMAPCNSTLNWAYVNHTDVAYFHSGRYPVRAAGVDPDLLTWGTGEFEWQGLLPTAAQPFAVNPRKGFATSWNNKPAKGWRAADDNYSYGPVYRSLALDVRLAAAVKAQPVSVADVVEAMADAATVDLRGQVLLPDALRLAHGDPRLRPAIRLLGRWHAAGAHRLDRDGDGRYDDPAVALMDEWYPRLLHAVFDPQLGDFYAEIPIAFDDAPSNSNLGSAYQGAFYGHLQKVLRQALHRHVRGHYRVLRCAGGQRSACGAAVRQSLTDAVATLTARFGSASPSTWSADAHRDDIHFSVAGLAAVSNIPWQNRPTFQQVVQVR